MDPFQHKGKIIDFFITTGQVAGERKWTEHDITTYGGGGYVSRDRGGYISAPTIRTTRTTKLEFFLVKPDGSEVPVQLSNFDAPLRDGQKVSMIGGVLRSNTNVSYWMLLLNHNANHYWQVLGTERILKLYRLEREVAIGSCLISFILGVFIITFFCGLGVFANRSDISSFLNRLTPGNLWPYALGSLVTLIFLFDYLYVRQARNRAKALIKAHLVKVANQGFYEVQP